MASFIDRSEFKSYKSNYAHIKLYLDSILPTTVGVVAWMINYITHNLWDVIQYGINLRYSMLAKETTGI